MTRAARMSLVLIAFLMLGPLTAGCGKRGTRRASDSAAQRSRSRRAEGRAGRGGRFGGDRGGTAAEMQPSAAPSAETSPGPYDGEWRGRTSQGRQLSFTVKANALATCTADLVVDDRSVRADLHFPRTAVGEIAGGAFTGTKPFFSPSALSGVSGSWVLVITGRFTPEGTAAGSLKWTNERTGRSAAEVSWKATRQP